MDLGQIVVWATMVDGEWVYCHEDAEGTFKN